MSPRPDAADKRGPLERFVARAVNISGEDASPGAPIDIMIERWSSVEESENLRRALIGGGPEQLLPALEKVRRRAGVVLFPGYQGLGARARGRRAENLQFAREITTPAGRQVVLATYRHLDFGNAPRNMRGAKSEISGAKNEFTLIDIRFGPDGTGVGKVGDAATTEYNKETNTLELKNYNAQPVRLREVRSQAVRR